MIFIFFNTIPFKKDHSEKILVIEQQRVELINLFFNGIKNDFYFYLDIFYFKKITQKRFL